MDRTPEGPLGDQIAAAARRVEGVRALEKLRVRRVGTDYYVDLHVQADPSLPLHDAHVLSGKVKGAIRSAVPAVAGVLIHMEPFEADRRSTTPGTEPTTPPPKSSSQDGR
jgi:divalent metal cation (Fe/Co/Zn/Cd) transporter